MKLFSDSGRVVFMMYLYVVIFFCQLYDIIFLSLFLMRVERWSVPLSIELCIVVLVLSTREASFFSIATVC